MRAIRSSTTTVVLPVLVWLALSGTTWNVYEDGSGDAPTINAAMDSAATGDTVLVWPGYYWGPVYVHSGINLISQGGSGQTTLEWNFAPILESITSEGTPTKIEGFTLTGAHPGYQAISSVRLRGEHEVSECEFKDLRIDYRGHALEVRGNTVVRDCTFQGITSLGGGFIPTAGVAIKGQALVEGCEFRDNSGMFRVGVNARGESEVTVRDCLFTDLSGGAAVMDWHSRQITVEGCLFLGNEARGIYSNGREATVVRGNTFVGNSRAAYFGGATAEMQNNLIAFNSEGAMIASDSHSIACNLVWGNVHWDWDGFDDPTGMDGNIRQDPLFCGAKVGNYHVASNSPCLPANNSCGVQIGALEEGCGAVSIESESWGGIKSLYR